MFFFQSYFDMKSKVVPEAVATKAAAILKEAWEVKEKLENLHCEMNVSDSETELTEEDVLHSIELRMKLDEFQKELEILENPLVRCLVMKKDMPYLSPEKNQRKSLDPVTHIVASCFSLSLIKDLPLDPEAEVEFYHQLGPAVAASCAGDTILILPGCYHCDGLSWLDHNLIIKGVKSEQEVVLEDVGNGDIFINCNAENLVLENLTIQPSEGIICAVMVHSGKTNMKNCTVKGKAAQSCLVVLSTAQMYLKTCKLIEAKSHGIQLRAGGKLTLDSSSITHCNRSGLQIELLSSCSTEITILNTTIENNKNFAICLDDQGYYQTKDSEKEVDLDFLYKCSLLKVKIQGVFLCHNALGSYGLCHQDILTESSHQRTTGSVTRALHFTSLSSDDSINEISSTSTNSDKLFDVENLESKQSDDTSSEDEQKCDAKSQIMKQMVQKSISEASSSATSLVW
ncbi:SHC SH2 domain-binding protein 1 homolog A-like [Limulus polyphemus]|uniref:SHC SH2 domain-binding protein 1 homolog A-like n=1 Tax=Limulus polyphemus TaxID=6850 RepID=A0ABM1SRA6_LIMPO|nr:SHC SH2 domain-binding protein 1 homolog A-like [Limulus polyphemus]